MFFAKGGAEMNSVQRPAKKGTRETEMQDYQKTLLSTVNLCWSQF